MRRFLLLLLVPVLLLAACGDDGDSGTSSTPTGDPATLDSIVIEDVEGSGPKLTFPSPFSVDETTVKVVTAGDGESLEEGAQVVFDFAAFNGRDGNQFLSSYDSGTESVTLNREETLPALVMGLVGSNVGSRLLIAAAPDDAWGPAGGIAEAGIEADDTTLFVIDVREVRRPLERAAGTAVDPKDGLPQVSLADDGKPSITIPEGDAPTTLAVQPLIEGEGEAVTAGQSITVHYTGVVWAGGKQFDSSWDRGAPTTFQIGLGAVIEGWDTGLVGQKIGSQVLLVIPPDMGYGAEGNSAAGISGTDTLVFVVDILDAY